METLATAVKEYRARAAERFANFVTNKNSANVSRNEEPVGTISTSELDRYKRCLFPELEQYLKKATTMYEKSKEASLLPLPSKKNSLASKLGFGNPVESLAAEVRHAKWVVARAVERHRRRAARSVVVDVVIACGIPIDVRQEAHQRFLDRNERHSDVLAIIEKVGCVEKGEGEDEAWVNGVRGDDGGFTQHIARCRDGLREGMLCLVARGKLACGKADTFEEVKKRYAGKPDEIYRRKTARKFATHRRKKRAMEQEALKKSSRAEVEMKRRRGHDHLLTGRKTGDSSFAPFLFQLDSNAYAFSSKISEAPKLRKAMIDKYSAKGESVDVNAWEKAHQAAETNPLFHTRVMNRFT